MKTLTRSRGVKALLGSMLACAMIATSTMTAVAIRPAEAASGASIVNLTCQSKNSFINTGRNQSTGKKMTSGTDPVWEFVNTGTNVTSPTQIPSTYWTSAKVSDFAADLGMPNAWVKSPYNNANWAGVLDLGENSYNWYRMRVNIDDDVALSTLKVTVKGAADDALGAVYVNGTSVAFTPVSFQNVGTIATLSGPWQTGLNTIIFRTWNVSNPSGLLLSADDTPIVCQEKDPAISLTMRDSDTVPTNTFRPGETTTLSGTVTNTGNVDLSDISMSSGLTAAKYADGETFNFTCPATTLAVGASMDCTARFTPDATGYANDGYVIMYPTASGTGAVLGGKTQRVGSATKYTLYRRFILTYDANNPTATVVGGPTFASCGSVYGCNGKWGTLATAFAPGMVFDGWFTAPAGGVQIKATTIAAGDITAHAHWHPTTFIVTFHPNAQIGTVSGAMPSVTYDSGCTSCTLPLNAWTKSTGAPELITENETAGDVKSSFLGWSLDPDSSTAGIADGAPAGGLSQGGSVDLYAVWDDAPSFHHDPFPNRYFTLEQAQAGDITETALLSTVSATDRETSPLETKTSEQVAASGDIGITLYDYDSTDFTAMTADGSISLTYKVKDAAGNTAFLRIKVTVSSTGPLPDAQRSYFRAISPDFVDQPSSSGGLADGSLWRTDPTRQALLDAAMARTNATCYVLSSGTLSSVKSHISESGFGNSENPDALSAIRNLLVPQTCQ